MRLAGVFTTRLNLAEAEEEPEVIPFSRDAEMEEYWDEHGYVPMPDGEGPVSIFYQVTRDFDRVVELREDAQDAQDSTANAEDDPYLARILTPFCLSITLVTPRDPTTAPFSRRMVDMLTESLRGGG